MSEDEKDRRPNGAGDVGLPNGANGRYPNGAWQTGGGADALPSPDVGAGAAPAAAASKTHAETVAALADSVWGAIASLSGVQATAPDGSTVAALSVDVNAAVEALGFVAARLIDAACDGGPPEHFHQLTGRLVATTQEMLTKLAAIRAAMKPPALVAPKKRIVIPGRG